MHLHRQPLVPPLLGSMIVAGTSKKRRYRLGLSRQTHTDAQWPRTELTLSLPASAAL
jgi:hypothetical protein